MHALHLRPPDGRPVLFWVLVLVGACQSGTVWAGLCLIHHHHQNAKKMHPKRERAKINSPRLEINSFTSSIQMSTRAGDCRSGMGNSALPLIARLSRDCGCRDARLCARRGPRAMPVGMSHGAPGKRAIEFRSFACWPGDPKLSPRAMSCACNGAAGRCVLCGGAGSYGARRSSWSRGRSLAG